MKSVLKVVEVSKTFGVKEGRRSVLKNISLEFFEGEHYCIIGKSGVGKSTFINILGLMEQRFEGECFINGVSYHNLSSKQKSGYRSQFFGYIFQDFQLLENKSVFYNLELPLLYANMSRTMRKKRVIKIASHCDINSLLSIKSKNLSGGERQRVAIARALVNSPMILIGDEITSSLDDETAKNIMEYILNVIDERCILIFVTHDARIKKYFHNCIELVPPGVVKSLK